MMWWNNNGNTTSAGLGFKGFCKKKYGLTLTSLTAKNIMMTINPENYTNISRFETN